MTFGKILLAIAAIASSAMLWFPAANLVSANQPAMHFVEDVTGDVISCDEAEYTVVSGKIKIVIHFGEAANGNLNFTGTVTPIDVVLTDGTDTFKIKGAEWFGGTLNANTGGEQATFTAKFQITGQGMGSVDSVNVTGHMSPNGNSFEFDFGTCDVPEE
jgi:hypothetical protein